MDQPNVALASFLFYVLLVTYVTYIVYSSVETRLIVMLCNYKRFMGDPVIFKDKFIY